MGWFTKAPERVYTPPAQDEVEAARRAAVLAAERDRVGAAHQAAAASEASVVKETSRLRDSREIAAALREQIKTNGFTERMRASMALREKGA